MLATSGTHSLAGAQATAMTQARTATSKAAEMPETVLMPTTREFSQKFAQKIRQNGKISRKVQRKRVKNSPILSHCTVLSARIIFLK